MRRIVRSLLGRMSDSRTSSRAARIASRCSAPRAPSVRRSFACSRIIRGSSSPRSPRRSARRESRIAEAARWIGADAMPPSVARHDGVSRAIRATISADIVFSALDSPRRGDAEPAFARAGKMVLTNAKNYRMDPDVPLVIAEVNPSHLDVLEAQRKNRGWKGGDRRQRQLRVDRRRVAAGADP